jgi:hypothetical protein
MKREDFINACEEIVISCVYVYGDVGIGGVEKEVDAKDEFGELYDLLFDSDE